LSIGKLILIQGIVLHGGSNPFLKWFSVSTSVTEER